MYLLHSLLEASAYGFKDKEAIVCKQESLTFSQVNQRANALARLILQHGIKKGDRVGVYLEKSIEQAISIWAISKAGGVFVVINPSLKASSVSHIMSDCDMVGVISSSSKLSTISSRDLKKINFCICLDSKNLKNLSGINLIDFYELKSHSSTNLDLDISDQDNAALIYTSGSTGLPKGVVLRHSNITLGAHAVSEYLNINSNDRILSLLPFSFDYGLNQMTTAFKEGATLVLKNYIFPEELTKFIESENITGLAGIPTIWSQLLSAKNISDFSYECLRYITNSGDKLSVEKIKKLQEVFPKTQIFSMYGLTEAFRATYLDPSELNSRPDSIGKAIPYAEIMVLTPDGNETKSGEVGELVQGGPLVAKGYWNNPQETNLKIGPHPFDKNKGEVCFSGDLVKRDEEGYIYFVGRNSTMIKSRGYRISPAEIEVAIEKHSDVQQVVAFGVKDESIGEQIIAVVQVESPSKFVEESIMMRCKQELPAYMIPKSIIAVETLPQTSSGKLDRTLIVKEYGK